MDRQAAQQAVWASALWQLRVLAGWAPTLGSAGSRVLAARFEIDNLVNHARALAGRTVPSPFVLGALGTAWAAADLSRSVGELRRVLRSSVWGDPGSDDCATMRLSLELSWCRQLGSVMAEAAPWATSYAVLLAARLTASEGIVLLPEGPAADARHLLGPAALRATSLTELARLVPRPASFVLAGVSDREDLWMVEVRWWRRVGTDATAMCAAPRPSAASVLGAGMLLLADARRVGGSLELAARGGVSDGASELEVIDAVA